MPRNMDGAEVIDRSTAVKLGANKFRRTSLSSGHPVNYKKTESEGFEEEKFYIEDQGVGVIIRRFGTPESGFKYERKEITSGERQIVVDSYREKLSTRTIHVGPRALTVIKAPTKNISRSVLTDSDAESCNTKGSKVARYYKNGKLKSARRVGEALHPIGSTAYYTRVQINAGPVKEYYKNGNLRRTSYYRKSKGRLYSYVDGVITKHEKNGAPLSRETIVNGEKKGWSSAYEKGNLTTSVYIHNNEVRNVYNNTKQTKICHKDLVEAKKMLSQGSGKNAVVGYLTSLGILGKLATAAFEKLSKEINAINNNT